jgi:hypothetical protein
MNTITNASVAGGDTATSFRTRAPISPASSDKPTPIITTRINVTATNYWKFLVNEVKMKRTPAPVRRPSTRVVSVWIL